MFDGKGITLKEVVEAGKQKIEGEDAWKLLNQAEEIVAGRGRKFVVFHAATDSKEEILKACLGRTGNLRAPALRIGNRMVVGFNDEMYRQYIG